MTEQLKSIVFLVATLLPFSIWLFGNVDQKMEFEYLVPKLVEISFFETSAFYFYIHLFSVVPVFLLSFDQKVAFFKSWKRLFPAIIIVGLGFVFWDVLFTKWNVWGFNENYLLGWEFFGLPFEEIFFFISIPFSSLFVHACLMAYFPDDHLKKWDAVISLGLGSVFIMIGLFNFDRIYTSTTFLSTGIVLVVHFLLFENEYRSYFYRSFLVILIPFIVVDGALTGWFTKGPVVLYHPEGFLGLRIGSVPIEDAIYGLLLLLLITTLQDWFSTRNLRRT